MRRIKSQTLEKLGYFKKYVEAYPIATKRLAHIYYVDAFAGTGKCIFCDERCKSRGGSACEKCSGEKVDGSALIALKTSKKFSKYIFVELNKGNVNLLRKYINKEIDPELIKKVNIENTDSNTLLQDIYKYIPRYAGCLIFLDPAGPELQWGTIRRLSKIKKVDLIILYPYEMSLARLTTEYKEKLDVFYGSRDWRDTSKKYGAAEKRRKLLDFYISNLKKLGFEFIVYNKIRRRLRGGRPLYDLILATHNIAGKNIMDDIFNKELDGQGTLNFRAKIIPKK